MVQVGTVEVAALPRELGQSVRGARMKFLESLEPLRPELHRYCRSLAGEPWDAEDLVQETLLRAFAKMGEIHFALERPRAWLFRIATNVWIDRTRRSEPASLPEGWDQASGEPAPTTPELREALERLALGLPPRERAAVLLKDVFDLSLEEVAAALGTTRGAVKAALHRARGKLEAARATPAAFVPGREPAPRALLDAFVDAFNARDLPRLASLLLEDASAEVVGMVQEYGREQAEKGSLHHTLFDEEGEPRAEVGRFRGESVVLLWYAVREGGESRSVVRDVLRFEADEGRIRSLRYYYFCPEVLAEVARELGVPLLANGYRYGPK